MGPNKILTVSYGAFSCTLEGFDDPFSAMKDIAEYFRDLAAQDRFFGAEPPTPDVQVLHAIAQSSATKPVQAAMTKEGVRLSQQSPTAASDTPVDGAANQEEPSDHVANTAEGPPGSDAGANIPVAEDASAPGNSPLPQADGNALPEIGESFAQPEVPVPVFAPDHSVLPEEILDDAMPDNDVLSGSHERAELDLYGARFEPETADLPPTEDRDTSDYEAEVSALFHVPSTDLPEPESRREQTETYANAGLSASSIAAKLQRIRSVVAASSSASLDTPMPDFDIEETDDLTDSITFAPPLQNAKTDNDTAETAADTGQALDEAPLILAEAAEVAAVEDLASEHQEPLETEATPDRLNGDLAAEAEPAVVADDAVIAATLSVLTQTSPFAVMESPRDDDALLDLGEDTGQDRLIDDPVEQDAWRSTEPASSEDQQNSDVDEPEVEEHKIAPLGLAQADLEAAAALIRTREAPRPEAFAHTAPPEPQDQSGSDTPELPEADLEPSAHEPTDAASSDEVSETPRNQIISDPDHDGTVERLLAETDTHLKDQGAQRRQSALSHLKAAVAATLADRIGTKRRQPDLPRSEPSEETDGADGDMARADTQDGCEAHLGDDNEVPPLVLVPQARIDQLPSDEAVRPRRITRSALSSQDSMRAQDTGFAEYAESVEATDLRDLLEAAAAYLSTVEGKSYFSRPDVMHLVMRHDRDHSFSREDSLRGFGDLLRDGTIEKISRGQFAISTESRFVANG